MNSERIGKYMKAMSAYAGASVIPMLLNIAVNPLIAMNMSPEDYAITGYFTSFNALINPIIIFYLLHYYTKAYFTLDEGSRLKLKSMIFRALIFFSLSVAVLCFVVLALYIGVGKSGSELPVFPYLLMTVFAIPLTGVYTLELTDFKMSKNSGAFFRLSVINGFLLVLANLIMVVVFKFGALGKLLAPLIINAVFFTYMLVKHKNYFAIPFDWRYFGRILKFCLPLAASAMLGYFFNGFDRTYAESIGNTHEYGFYIVGAQIAGYLTTFSVAISSTFQPDIYEAIARSDRKRFLKSASAIVLLISAVVLVFIAAAPFLIRLLTAGRYVESAPYARLIAMSTITSSVYYIVNNYTIAKGYPALYLYTTIVGSLFMMAAVPVAVEKWEFFGAAVMVALSYLFLTAVNIIFLIGKKAFRNFEQKKK